MSSQTNLNHSKIQVWKRKAKFERITRLLFYLLVMFILTSTGTLVDLTALPTEAQELRPVATNETVPLNDPIAPADISGAIIDWEYDQLRPAVAYGSQRGEYLVVWEDHHWGWGYNWAIYGQRVNSNGTLNGGLFGISWEGSNQHHRENPDVAYNPAADEFLVVYEYELSAINHDIRARRVNSDGLLIGGEFFIGTASNFESNPAVAYNSANNEYLVVWEYRASSGDVGPNDIYGRRLAADGTPLSPSFAITNGSLDESAPALAYGGGAYLVVWQYMQAGTGDYDIYGRRLGNDGSLGSKVAIAAREYDQLKPRLTFNSTVGEFLVVWEDHYWGWGNNWDIYGQRVNPNGTLNGGNFGISWEGSNQHHRENPDVAYNPTADEFLVTWEYEFSVGDHDVYCRQVGSDGTLETEKVISSLSSHEGGSVVAADNGGLYLVVWEDERNVATQGIDLYYRLKSFGGGPGSNNVYLPIILRPSS